MITSPRYLRSIPAAIVFLTTCAGMAQAQPKPYHILLTNDDGITSPGLTVLADTLRTIGQVHVFAPCGQRSGASMSVALRDELRVRPVQREGQPLEHCVNTSPAGAALLALTTLAPEGGFDLVVSGINRGANVGTSSHMSGTVGGAMMGALYGVPALAVSLGARTADFDYSARFVVHLIEELRQHPPMRGIVLSVNIPRATETENTGVVVAKMGGSDLHFAYEEIAEEDGERRFRPRIGRGTNPPDQSDTEGFMRDMITITPLQFDWTAHSVVAEMKTWAISKGVAR